MYSLGQSTLFYGAFEFFGRFSNLGSNRDGMSDGRDLVEEFEESQRAQRQGGHANSKAKTASNDVSHPDGAKVTFTSHRKR